jgi:hypothetical protein
VIKPSPIPEGVTEIRINYYLERDKHNNTTLESHEDTMSGHNSQRLPTSLARPTIP